MNGYDKVAKYLVLFPEDATDDSETEVELRILEHQHQKCLQEIRENSLGSVSTVWIVLRSFWKI